MANRINRREFLKRALAAAGGLAASELAGGCRSLAPNSVEPPAQDITPITILHTNDLHGALRPTVTDGVERGGMANLVGLIERKRAAAAGPVLLLDAGDAFQGTYISNSNRGQAVIEVMNAAGVQAMALGNHEFDWGLGALQARRQQARFPFLAANLETGSGDRVEGIDPYAILDAGGIRVAVLGLTYHDIKTIVTASAIEGLRSTPPVETARRYLPQLQEQSDVVVVLSHLGIESDRELARALPEIPLIVGGHSHQVLPEGERVGDTWIVNTGAYGQYLGRLVVHYDRAGRQIVDVDTHDEAIQVQDAGIPSAEVQVIVDEWAAEADEQGEQVIGEAAIPLRMARGGEAALGDLITDAMRVADMGDGRTSDIALHNDGGIRTDIDAGPITFAEIYAVLPFDNTLVSLDLTGKQVKEMLESGIGAHASEIQVSGTSFTYSLNKAQGRRIIEVEVGGKPLDPERTYRVVTINYLQSHPQYKDSLGQGTHLTYGPLCLDAVIEYIRAHSPVQPRVEQRIRKL